MLPGMDRKRLQQGLFALFVNQQRKIPSEPKFCNLKFVWQRMVLDTEKVSSERLITPTTKTNNRQLQNINPNTKLNV